MTIKFNRHSLLIVGFSALLANACGDDGEQKGPVDGAVDTADGAVDAGAQEAGGPEEPPPSAPLDAGGGPEQPAPTSDAGPHKTTPGTLLDLPFNGQLLSLCYADSDCKGADLGCYAAFGTVAGYCSSTCESDDDCSPIGGLKATCAPENLCRVDCSGKDDEGDGACPLNMECRDFFDPSVVIAGEESEPGLISIWRCGYPVHSGSNQVEPYQQCNLEHGSGDCKGALLCHAPSSGLTAPSNPGYCSQACESKAECSAPGATSAMPVCTDGTCELDCAAAGATCPSGMNCRQVGGPASQIQRCRFIKTP